MPRDRYYWGFHEYGAYIGPIIGLLAVWGVLRAWRRAWPWILMTAGFISLGLGDFGTRGNEHTEFPLSPWAVLHKLPFFSSQHVPSRFLLVMVLCFSVVAGYGVDALAERAGRRGLAVILSLLLLSSFDAWWRGPPNLHHMFEGRAVTLPPAARFEQVWDATRSRQGQADHTYPIAASNRGALNCYEPGHLDSAAIAGLLRPSLADINVVSAPSVAASRGIIVEEAMRALRRNSSRHFDAPRSCTHTSGAEITRRPEVAALSET